MTPGLAIIGHGKMGRLVEHLTPQHGFEVRSKFSSANNAEARGLTRESLNGATIAIEFSTSAAAPFAAQPAGTANSRACVPL